MKMADGVEGRVSLITRTNTINQGNQALSVAWRNYLSMRYPRRAICLYERVPEYLRRYTLSSFEKATNPISEFDRIAQSLVNKVPEEVGEDPAVWDVKLDMARRKIVRFYRLRQILKLRSRMGWLNLGMKKYLNRLGYILRADLVVINPAGEFHSSSVDTALLYLLEARCAQLAGRRTAIVNLSFEVEDPTVIQISRHVFSSCEIVEFRDVESRQRLMLDGGVGNTVVLPDAVILSPVTLSRSNDCSFGTGLALNGPQVIENRLVKDVCQFISKLIKRGPVKFISNEWATDCPYWDSDFYVEGVEHDGYGLDFADYANFLARFNLVISSRLHTCVLGMLAGAVVVPVECGTFKLSGFFEQIGMPDEPIKIGSNGWQEKLLERVAEIEADREDRLRLQSERINEAIMKLRTGLDRVFDDGNVDFKRIP